jgi:hypothetical protein
MGWFFDDYENNEVGTKKSMSLLDFGTDSSQYQDHRDYSSSSVNTFSDSRSFSTQSSRIFNPVDNRSLNLVLNSAGANVSTKKDMNASTTPSFSNAPSTSVSPSNAVSKAVESAQSLTNGLDIQKALLFGGVAVGGFLILKKTPLGKKLLRSKK